MLFSPLKPGAAVKRPRLSLTVNAKIPTSLRQKFLNSFIDEHLKMTSDPQQAYDKVRNETLGGGIVCNV